MDDGREMLEHDRIARWRAVCGGSVILAVKPDRTSAMPVPNDR